MKRNAPYFALIAVLLALDQASKALVEAKIELFRSVPVIPGFFSLSRVHNKGAIFGLFNHSDQRWISVVLAGLSLTALILVLVYFVRTPADQKLMRTTLAVILAGALGNQIDRIFRGYVVDFLEIHIKRFYWPTFNVADSCVSIGAVLLIYVFFVRRPS
jgi:signal peptidase II